MSKVDEMTGDELNQTEAKLSRKMRAGDATPEEIKQYNMISRRMGAVNIIRQTENECCGC